MAAQTDFQDGEPSGGGEPAPSFDSGENSIPGRHYVGPRPRSTLAAAVGILNRECSCRPEIGRGGGGGASG